MPTNPSNSYIEEASALLDLGLYNDAAILAERLQTKNGDIESQYVAMEVLTRLGCFEAAASCGDNLLEAGNCPQDQLFRIALAFNYAGRVQEAYNIEKAIVPLTNDAHFIRLYGLACKASRLGLYNEALGYLMGSFRFQNVESWDAHRKIFIDSELTAFWENLPSLKISLREAMRYCNHPFDEILSANENLFPLRCLDFMDLETMPERFRILLQPAHNTCFEINPRQEAANPELHQEFIRWQESIVQPRLEAFKSLIQRIRKMVIDQQLAFAEFQASRGRIASARNHLVCHLEFAEKSSLEDIPDIAALKPLLNEFRAMQQECPEAFQYLISWKCKKNPEEFIRDVHSEMPSINRESGYAHLALGCMHYRLGNTSAAIEHWFECAKKWPTDDAPLMNAAMLLSGENRWAEASELIERLPNSCMESSLWKKACTAIRDRRAFSISAKIYATPNIPTPTFGGLYSGADEEYLVEKKQYTSITC